MTQLFPPSMVADKGRKLSKGGIKKTSADYMAELMFLVKKIASQRNKPIAVVFKCDPVTGERVYRSKYRARSVEEHLHVHLLQSLHILQIVSVMEMQMNSVCF